MVCISAIKERYSVLCVCVCVCVREAGCGVPIRRDTVYCVCVCVCVCEWVCMCVGGGAPLRTGCVWVRCASEEVYSCCPLYPTKQSLDRISCPLAVRGG